MNHLEFLVLALAVWRLTSLLVNEDGPFAMFEHMRLALGVAYDEYSQRYAKNRLAGIFICMWCASLWVSFALAGFWFAFPEIVFIFCLPFALSTVAIAIQEAFDG